MGTSQVIAPNPAQKHNPDHMAGVYVMPLKAFAELKKEGAIVSPVRCKWEPAK